jgi:hypothetical protein
VSRLLPAIFILLCSSPSKAQDAGAVIAGMKTEAEECRYVLDICQRVRSEREALKGEPDSKVNSDARVRWDFLRSMTQADEERLRAALRAMQAKHSQRPKCLDECKDLGA